MDLEGQGVAATGHLILGPVGWGGCGLGAVGWAAVGWGGRGLGGHGQHFSGSNVPVSLHSLWRPLTGALQTVGQGPHL